MAGFETKPNQDRWGRSERTGWVLDGASQPEGTRCCRFDPREYVAALDASLADLAPHLESSLPDLLRAALQRVTEEHGRHHDRGPVPAGPASTVAAASVTPTEIRWLVLGDAGIVAGDPPTLIVDDRLAAIAQMEREQFQLGPSTQAHLTLYRAELAARNQIGGYWVAADRPDAAFMALNGAAAPNKPIVLMTDGVHRHIGSNGIWPDAAALLDELTSAGPNAILCRVRDDPAASGRSADDATVLLVDPQATDPLVDGRV